MHLGERHTWGKATSPLIAASLSTSTYESWQNDLIILTEQIVPNRRRCYLKHGLKLVVDSIRLSKGVLNVTVNVWSILKSVDKKRYAQLLFGRIVFVITFINELFLSHPSVAEDNKSMTLLIKVTFNIMVSEAQLSWFRSYICGREQYVCVNVTHLKVIFII